MTEEADSIVSKVMNDFVEVTAMGTPSGERHFKHLSTGKVLVITAKWLEKEDDLAQSNS